VSTAQQSDSLVQSINQRLLKRLPAQAICCITRRREIRLPEW